MYCIQSPQELKNWSIAQLEELAGQIRATLIDRVTTTGGHMGSNLGVVEATIALHYVFDTPRDKLVFDVSHQSYTHKLLTGRMDAFTDPAHYADVTGYTNPAESEYDVFSIGHTSTSISLACGLVAGRDAKGEQYNVVAFIGDGSLSGGEALSGLDNAGAIASNLIIVLNDNEMSIAPNHGGMYANLAALRQSNGTTPNNLFTAFGLDYLYVENGNSLPDLIRAFRQVKNCTHPTVVHIHTQKGKGLEWAETNKEAGHWAMPKGVTIRGEGYPKLTADFLLAKAKKEPLLLAVNPANPGSIGWSKEWRQEMGKQYTDVGICEEHAVAVVSGAAKAGAKPVLGIMSTFAQRTYDQLLQDLALNHSPATILVYGGGFDSYDPTHANYYDIPLMSNIPGLLCLAPSTQEQFFGVLDWSIDQEETPVVIRMPQRVRHTDAMQAGKDWMRTVVKQGSPDIVVVALGDALDIADELVTEMKAKEMAAPTVVNPAIYSEVDSVTLDTCRSAKCVVTLECGQREGGYGAKVAMAMPNIPVLVRGGDKHFVERVPVAQQLEKYRMTSDTLIADILSAVGK